jgi:hypothetical protein
MCVRDNTGVRSVVAEDDVRGMSTTQSASTTVAYLFTPTAAADEGTYEIGPCGHRIQGANFNWSTSFSSTTIVVVRTTP